MKKFVIGLAAFAMTLVPSVAMAQSATSGTDVKVEKTQKYSKKDKKGKKEGRKGSFDSKDKKACSEACLKDGKQCKAQSACKDGKKCGAKSQACKNGKGLKDGHRGGRAYNDSVNFASLNLSADQQAKVKALNEARKASYKELQAQRKAAKAEAKKAAEQIGQDPAFDFTQVETVQTKYLKDLREVLTADQYVQFLENNYVKAQRPAKGVRAQINKKAAKKSQRDGRMIKPMKAEANAQ